MTFAQLNTLIPKMNLIPKDSESLKSKGDFDTVGKTEPNGKTVELNIEKKRPEINGSGLGNLSKSGTTATKEDSLSPIVAQTPDLRKQVGVFMSTDISDEGFIKLPRSLLKSESWRNLRQRQQKLFIYILEKAQHSPYVFKYNGKDILLSPGDMCISLRRLVDDYNSTVRFKDEKIDLPFVQRAVSTFSKVGLTDTRTDTGISIVRVVFPGIYDASKTTTDTQTDTLSIQDRYTNEERKEGKDIKETIDGAKALDSSLINLEKEQKASPSIFTPQQKPQDLSAEKLKNYHALWEIVVKKNISATTLPGKGIKEQDLMTWIKKYDAQEIYECIKLAEKASVQKTYGGYVTKLLKDRIPKREADSKSGKDFVIKFVKEKGLKHIDLKQDYFKDLISQEQSYYYLPLETLKAILDRSVARAKEQEEEDRRQDQYEDY